VLKLCTVFPEEAALDAEEAAQTPAARNDAVRQEKLELAYGSQLGT